MTVAAVWVALVAAAVNLGAAAWAGLLWWRVTNAPRAVWRAIRGAQAASVLHAVIVGGLFAAGLDAADDLYLLYVGLPIAVSFVAEQIRVLAAQTVLDARGMEDAAAVGRLPAADQQSIVVAILRRELGVMAAACAACTFLLLRAASTVS